jgi:hypothetical protein
MVMSLLPTRSPSDTITLGSVTITPHIYSPNMASTDLPDLQAGRIRVHLVTWPEVLAESPEDSQ